MAKKKAVENKSLGELSKLLEKEYSKIILELKADHWFELMDDIFFDKAVNGCWVIRKTGSRAEVKNELHVGGFLGAFATIQNVQSNKIETIRVMNSLHKHLMNDTKEKEIAFYLKKHLQDPINKWEIPSIDNARYFSLSQMNNFDSLNGAIGENSVVFCRKGNEYSAFNTETGRENQAGTLIPFLPLSKTPLSLKKLFLTFLKKGFTPKALKNSQGYRILLSAFHYNVVFSEENKFTKMKNAVSLLLERESNEIANQLPIHNLLNEDKIRADITPYHPKMLKDLDQGHWSLWPMAKNDSCGQTVELGQKLVARDPNSSINNGVVGITASAF